VKPPGPEINWFTGVVSHIETSLDLVRLTVAVEGNRLVTELPHHIFESLGLEVGQEVFLILKLKGIKVCEDVGEQEKLILEA
jgi:ABC-type molybdate transport system ATPase subunit